MKIVKTVSILALALSASGVFANTSVERLGRQAAIGDVTVKFAADCAKGCHVTDVLGRGVQNNFQPGSADSAGELIVRALAVDAVQGRA
jgi:hypothetical protein